MFASLVRIGLSTVLILVSLTVTAFAQPSSPAVQIEVGYQHETGLGRTGSFNGIAATLVVPLDRVFAPAIKVSSVIRNERFSQFEVRERLISVGVGGRARFGQGTVRPWVQLLVGLLSDNYQRGGSVGGSSDIGFFAEAGAGFTVEVNRRIGVYASAGWKPAILGYPFSGSHLSAGVSVGLGHR